MADLTKTITNTLNCFGGTPPSVYGTARYGTDVYGSGSVDGIDEVGKYLENTLASDSAMTALDPNHLVANTLSFSSDLSSEVLTNGIWTYLFIDEVTNAEDRSSNTWASQANQSSTYANVSSPATSWS